MVMEDKQFEKNNEADFYILLSESFRLEASLSGLLRHAEQLQAKKTAITERLASMFPASIAASKSFDDRFSYEYVRGVLYSLGGTASVAQIKRALILKGLCHQDQASHLAASGLNHLKRRGEVIQDSEKNWSLIAKEVPP